MHAFGQPDPRAVFSHDHCGISETVTAGGTSASGDPGDASAIATAASTAAYLATIGAAIRVKMRQTGKPIHAIGVDFRLVTVVVAFECAIKR